MEDGAGKKSPDFVVTPPLSLSKPPEENVFRMIHVDGTYPKDRETLFYLNVKVIPSISNNVTTGGVIHISATAKLKMFWRPEGLKIDRNHAPSLIRFLHHGNLLNITNPTPYYLTMVMMKSGNHAIPDTMLSPYGAATLLLPEKNSSSLTYSTINDYSIITAPQKVEF